MGVTERFCFKTVVCGIKFKLVSFSYSSQYVKTHMDLGSRSELDKPCGTRKI